MTTHTRPDLGADPEAQRRALRAAFPGWSIIHTDRGNWWATRAPLVREDLDPNDIDTLTAPTAGGLYDKLSALR